MQGPVQVLLRAHPSPIMALTRQQLATRIRDLRESLGFTQAQVDKTLSVNRHTVSEIEAARRQVTGEALHPLANLFAAPNIPLAADPTPTSEHHPAA